MRSTGCLRDYHGRAEKKTVVVSLGSADSWIVIRIFNASRRDPCLPPDGTIVNNSDHHRRVTDVIHVIPDATINIINTSSSFSRIIIAV